LPALILFQVSVGGTQDAVAEDKSRGRSGWSINIFNAILMASLLFIVLAIVLLVIEVGDYGGALSSPWRTGSVGR